MRGITGPAGIKGATGIQGPAVDGGGVIPYEPYNPNIVLSSDGNSSEKKIVFVKFISPSTGSYTHIQFLTSWTSSANYQGSIGNL